MTPRLVGRAFAGITLMKCQGLTNLWPLQQFPVSAVTSLCLYRTAGIKVSWGDNAFNSSGKGWSGIQTPQKFWERYDAGEFTGQEE